MLDADNYVVNYGRKVEDIIIGASADVYLQERLYNNELASYAFLVRNSAFGRAFLQNWTEYGKLVQQVEHQVLHNYDNGALQLLTLRSVGYSHTSREYKTCERAFLEGSYGTYLYYDRFVGCCRTFILKTIQDDLFQRKLYILPKGQGFTRDLGDSHGWCEADLLIHGTKDALPYHYTRNVTTTCDLSDLVSSRQDVEQVRESLEYAEMAGRHERIPAFGGMPIWDHCYPNCSEASEYSLVHTPDWTLPAFNRNPLPSFADWECYWKRYAVLWPSFSEWNDTTRDAMAHDWYVERGFMRRRNPYCDEVDVSIPQPKDLSPQSPPWEYQGYESLDLLRVKGLASASPEFDSASQEMKIPHIIHRTGPWPLDSRARENLHTWQTFHALPWQQLYWTDKQADVFIRENLPWFASCWDDLQFDIMRYDAARAAWLYVIGGVYADMDVDIGKDHSDLMHDVDVVLVENNEMKHNNPWPGPHVDNWYMASVPGPPIFARYLNYICNQSQHMKIIDPKGPKKSFASWRPELPVQKLADPNSGATVRAFMTLLVIVLT